MSGNIAAKLNVCKTCCSGNGCASVGPVGVIVDVPMSPESPE